MKTRLVFLALLLFVTWVSSSQMNRLIGGNTPSLIAKSTSGGSELPSGDEKGLKHKQPVNTVYYLKFGEDKFDINCLIRNGSFKRRDHFAMPASWRIGDVWSVI
jgi:hypothetical protein